MNPITCDVITDLLELYSDDVVSEDTKMLVEEHLRECTKCEEKLMQIRQNLSIPVETNQEPLRQIKRSIKKRIIIISLVSVFVVAGLLLGAFYYISQHKTAIPYDKTHIYSVEQGDNDWEIKLNYMDNIVEYRLVSTRLDDITAEYYIFFSDTYHTRHFSNSVAGNSYISIPAYDSYNFSIVDLEMLDEPVEAQTVRIYYCIFTSGNGRMDFSDRYLIWEKHPDKAETISPFEHDASAALIESDNSAIMENDVSLQEQLIGYLSELFNDAFEPHYEGLHYEMVDYVETLTGKSYISTFLWTMHHLDNGLDVPNNYGKEQKGNMFLQVIAEITADGKLNTATIAMLADNSFTGPPTYLSIADFFPPPPPTPPVDKELVKNYVQTYMQLITEGDLAELARFLLIDGGVTDEYIDIAQRIVEYYEQYDTAGALVQRVTYHEIELERLYFVIVRDGQGELFRVNLGYGDGLVGIDVRLFE